MRGQRTRGDSDQLAAHLLASSSLAHCAALQMVAMMRTGKGLLGGQSFQGFFSLSFFSAAKGSTMGPSERTAGQTGPYCCSPHADSLLVHCASGSHLHTHTHSFGPCCSSPLFFFHPSYPLPHPPPPPPPQLVFALN